LQAPDKNAARAFCRELFLWHFLGSLIGTAAAILLFGALGLFYRPNRRLGFFVGTGVAAALALLGIYGPE